MSTLDHAAVAAVDSTGQLDEVLGLPEHLRTRCGASIPRARGRSTPSAA